MIKTHRIVIDETASASELINAWVNGNLDYVIDALANDHAGLTALVIVQGAQDGRLTATDCNRIANLLIDRRVEFAREN